MVVVQRKRALLKDLDSLVRQDYAVAWRQLGEKLGVPIGKLNALQKDFPDNCERCCFEVLQEWRDNDFTSLWSTMLEALNSPKVLAVIHEYSDEDQLLQHKELEMVNAVSVVSKCLKQQSIDNRYKVSTDEWPNIELKHFTSVALIHYKRGHSKKEEIEVIAKNQHKGEVTLVESLGDANLVKTTKDISEIFVPMDTANVFPKTILIEGAPGIGKTTLSKEIMFQWSSQNLLHHVKLLVVVFLRDPIAQGIRSLKEFVCTYCDYTEKSNSIIEEYLKSTLGKDIAIILDGYDELPEDIRINTELFFIKLINRNCTSLQKCMVIITSRLNVSVELHRIVDRRVEILGFTEENRKEFIREALKDNSQGTEKLLQYLERNPAIDAYCYIPLNMTILLCLFNEGGENTELPITQTEINKKFICITISRFIIKIQKEHHEGISDFSAIPLRYKPLFLELCTLAFQALCNDQIVFTKAEIRNICKDIILHSGNWNGLGLLKAVEFYNYKENIKNISFNFLHLSLQETLAAYHITLLSKKKQINLLKEKFLNSRYFNTWIMYVGLTKGQFYAFRQFLSGKSYPVFLLRLSKDVRISNKLIANKVTCLHLFQCFSEAENDEMCQYVGYLLQDKTIDLSYQTLSPVNINTIGLFLGRSTTKHWKLLNLSNCYIGDAGIEQLHTFSSSSKNIVRIDDLDLSYNNFSPSSAALLVDLFLAWNIKRVEMHSGDSAERNAMARNVINGMVDHMSKIDYPQVWMEIFTTQKSILVLCKQEYEVVKVALHSGHYSNVHLCSCDLGDTYEELVQMVLILAKKSVKVCLHDCKLSFHNVIDCVMRSEILSFHYFEQRNLTFVEIETAIVQTAELVINLGDSTLPLHFYNILTEKTLGLIKEELVQSSTHLGTFIFRNCRDEDIKEILLYFDSFLTCKNMNSTVTLQETIDKPKTTIVFTQLLTHFLLNVCCLTSQAVIDSITDVIKQCRSMQNFSLVNSTLQDHNILLVCETVETFTSLLYINLSGNDISIQAAESLSVGINNNVHLRHLELANCSLYKESLRLICIAIGNRDLQTLNLSGNCITDNIAYQLANVITSAKCIENLHLERCSLQCHGIQVLTTALTNIKSLKLLNLSQNNKFKDNLVVAAVIHSNGNLEHLDLSFCELQEISMIEMFKANLVNLKVVNFSGNHISNSVAHRMQAMICNAASLQHLSLSNCSLNEQGIVKVMEGVKCSLRLFDISSNVITDEAAKSVATAITRSTELEHLDLSCCGLQELGFDLLLEAVNKNATKLKYIDLKSNAIGDALCTNVAKCIVNNKYTLKHLCLSNCALEEDGLLRIAEAFKQNNLLIDLDISSNFITDKASTTLATADLFFKKSQLQYLNISYCRWQKNSLSELLVATMNNRYLKYINLSGCSLDSGVVHYLAGTLNANDTLEKLILANCALNSKGLISIFVALRNLTTLRYLDLSDNQITDEAVTALAEAIFCNHLLHLNLSNCLQDAKSSVIVTAIANRVTFKSLDLSNNGISDEGAAFMTSAIVANKYLRHINLSNNCFNNKSIESILHVIAMTNSLHHVDLSSFNITDELAGGLEELAVSNGGLQDIVLSMYAVCDVKIQTVHASLSKLVVRKMLCINDQIIDSNEADKIELLITKSDLICHIDLANCVIPVLHKHTIIKSMQKHFELSYLNFNNITFTEEAEDELVSLFIHVTKLQHLEMAGCELSQSFFIKLSEVLKIHATLQHLNVSNNTLHEPAVVSISKSLSNIRGLECTEMAGCELSDKCLVTVFKALSNLYEMTKLNFSCNAHSDHTIEALTTVIANNTSLQHIKMAGSKLSHTGLIKFAEALKSNNLTKLLHLDISGNSISGEAADKVFSTISGCNNLTHLVLCDCKCGHSFNKLSTVSTLTYLDLSNNPITDVHVDDVTNLIANNNNLQHLDLSSCGFKSRSILKIIDVLKWFKILHYLNLTSNLVSDSAEVIACNIAALISSNSTIQHLYLPQCLFHDDHLKVIFQAMKSISSLICVDINCNQISDSLSQDVATVIAVNTHMKIFRLWKLCLSQIGLENLNVILPKFRMVKFVSLHQCLVSDEYLKEFCEMFSDNQNISHLTLHDCRFSDADNGTSRFLLSLKHKNFLQISLSGMVFTNNVVQNLALLIASNLDIQHFNLDNCKISGCYNDSLFSMLNCITNLHNFSVSNMIISEQTGVEEAFKNSKSLQHLSFLNCKLTITNALLVCEAIKNITSLLHINLNGNNISNQAAEFLSAGINNNVYLQQLELANCNLREEGLRSICFAIRERNLLSLNLNCNCITDKVAGDLAHIISNRKCLEDLHMKKCSLKSYGIHLLNGGLAAIKSLKLLDLSYNKMTNTSVDLAAVLYANSDLEHLNLSNCEFQELTLIEVVKANFLNLKVFNVSGNHISDSVAHQMQALISNAASLQHLSVSNCSLKEQGITEVMESINSSLRHLDISLNMITDEAAKCVATVIVKSAELEYLDLSYCGLQNKGFSLILEAIKSVTKLKHIDLEGNVLNDILLSVKLASIVESNRLLNLVCLSNCALMEEGMLKVADAFKSCRLLSHVNISSNLITDMVIARLTEVGVFSMTSQLKSINVSQCHWQTNSFITNLLLATINVTNLKSINCSRCVINDEDARQLAKAITVNVTLEQLILADCTLQPDGIAAILCALKKLNTLNYVDFSHNRFTDKVAKLLAEFILCSQIEHLNLSDCLQGVLNSSDVLTSIANSVTLQYLDLSYNDISDEANCVASVIIANEYLHHVNLTNNQFGGKTIIAILHAMTAINSLKHVNLGSYCITDESATVLEAVANSNNLEDIVLLGYAICNVQLENLPKSISSLVVRQALCINDQIVNDYEAHRIMDLITKSSSVIHIELANCVIPISKKAMIVRAIQKLPRLSYINLNNTTFTVDAEEELAFLFTQNNELQHLEISGCALREPCLTALAGAMKEYKKILHLNLSNNTITETAVASFCDSISETNTFECLAIADCGFSESSILSLIMAVGKLHSLTKLNFSGNVLSENAIEILTIVLENNPSLQHIEMARCNLSSSGVIKLTEALKSTKITELLHLDLSSNDIAGKATDDLLSVIASCKKLNYLGLGNCNMSALCLSIFNALSVLTTLTYLDLSNNLITDAYADNVADVIANNNKIQHLNLSSCGFKSSGTVKILEILKRFMTLQYLNLGLNLGPNNSEIVTSSIAALITSNSSIEHFYLPRCLFQEKHLKVIFQAMKNINSLICVDISCNHISDVLCQEVAAIVASNPDLKEFRLCGLIFSHCGFEYLSCILRKFRMLQHVSLHHCHVSEEQLMEVCEMFSNNEFIAYLNVDDCVFPNMKKVVYNLFKSLRHTKCLKNFSLKSVIFTHHCIDYVLGMIEVNKSIEHFFLEDCEMSESTKVSLFKALKGISTFQDFSVSNMIISDTVSIADVLKNNMSLKYLNLSNCKLQTDSVWLICNTVQAITTLARINLSSTNISKKCAKTLAVGIIRNTFLQHLELDRCNLCEEGLRSICNAICNSDLLTLSLSCNCITDKVVGDLASVLFNNRNIEHIHMKGCKLDHDGIKILVMTLAKMKSLKTIDLSHNKLSYRDIDVATVVIANSSLECLNLSYCQLQECTISDVVDKVNAVNLVALNFSGNYISDSVAHQMQAMISNAAGLQHLSLSNCSLQEQGIIEIMEGVNHSLKHLDISLNLITDEVAKYVATVIVRTTELEHLDLACCDLKEVGFGLILEAVNNIAKLKYLDLKSNIIVNNASSTAIATFATNNDAMTYVCLSNCGLLEERLFKLLNSFNCRILLSHLDISSNFITNNVIDKLKKSDVFSMASLLKHVNFSHCQWQRNGFLKILMALSNMCSLKGINCAGCSMDDEAVQYLARSIAANSTLEKLVLSNCRINAGQLLTICNALTNIDTLKHLDLSNNHITNEMIMKLVEILSGNQIEHLDLSYCLLGANSFALVTAIANSVTLQYLDLSYNDISDDEARYVASVITANKYLYHLNLTNNQFCCESIQTILIAMSKIYSLKHVDLSSYSITDELAVELEEVAVSNSLLDSIVVYRYAIQKVKLDRVPASSAKLVLKQSLCINDHTIYDNEASCIVEALIRSKNSICHIDLANCILPISKKLMILRAMKKHRMLKHLNISNISVTNEAEHELACVIQQNTNLQHLELAGCELTGSILPKALDSLKNLLHLNLSFNTVTTTAAANMINVLSNNSRLECLEIGGCELNEVNALGVIRALMEFHNILKLNLSLNILSDYAIEMLTIVLANNPLLQQIEMAGCNLSSCGVTKLTESLKSSKLTGLSHLDLSNNDITGEATDDFFLVIASCKKLNYLGLCSCKMTAPKMSFNSLSALTTLTHLDLSNNSITDANADDVANVIVKNHNLQHLNLSTCGFKSQGILKILMVLKHIVTLKYLNLGFNFAPDNSETITSDIATLIISNSTIQHLYLPNCLFHDDHLKVMFQAMKNVTSLICVDISCNQISDSLCQDFVAVVAANPHFKTLRLFKLVMTQFGFEQLSEVLQKFRKLQEVVLCNCYVTDCHFRALCIVFSNNQTLTHFSVVDSLFVKESNATFTASECLTFTNILKYFDLKNVVFIDNSVNCVLAVLAANQGIEHFSLTDCRMTDFEKYSAFRALRNVRTLKQFSLKNITINEETGREIATIISENVNLNGFELTGCGAMKNSFYDLGYALHNHKNLSHIKLNRTSLTTAINSFLDVITRSTKMQRIEIATCDFDESNITKLVETIKSSQYKHLVHLDLSNNNFNHTATKAMLAMITSCVSLKHLELCNCGIIIPDLALPESLNIILPLTYLDLSRNLIGRNGAGLVAVLLIRYSKIEHINLSNCRLQSSEICMLIKAMKNVTSLQYVDLSMNDSRDGTLAPIEPVIRSNMLHFLHLPIQNFSKQYLEKVVELVANTPYRKLQLNVSNGRYFVSVSKAAGSDCQKVKSLEFLDTERCRSTIQRFSNFESNHIIVVTIYQLPSIQKKKLFMQFFVNVSSCKDPEEIGTPGVPKRSTLLEYLNFFDLNVQNQEILEVCEAVKNIPTLLQINLNGNNITNQIAEVLTAGIARNIMLQHLDLTRCNFYKEGLRSICNALKNRNILTLNLSCNCITDEVASELACAITERNCIENLHLNRCSLKYNGIQLLIAAMAKVKTLKVLDFSDNKLSFSYLDLSSVISANRHLEHLNFSCCGLTENTLISLFKDNTVSLKVLNLSTNTVNNSVADLMTAMIGDVNNISLSNCNLQEIGMIKLLSNVKHSLEYLDISSNVISDEAANSVADLIFRSSKLEHLNLANCEIHEEGFSAIVKAITECAGLKHIDLKSDKIVDSTMTDDIGKVIEKNHSLNHLCLSDCVFREDEMSKVANSVAKLKSLNYLDISLNVMTPAVVSTLEKSETFNDWSPVTYLNLSSCQWHGNAFSNILHVIRNLHDLNYLNFSGYKMNDQEARNFADFVSIHGKLETLILSNCELSSVGLETICGEIKKINTIKYLDFSSNDIIEEALPALAEVLFGNKIEHLNLHNCLPGTDISSILTAIANSVTLQHLDLSINFISDINEASCLASAITDNCKLQYISLWGNFFDSQGIKVMLIAMTKINSLRCIDLCSYNIADELAAYLEAVAISNGGIEKIKLNKYAIEKVKLVDVPASVSKLELSTLCLTYQNFGNNGTSEIECLLSNSETIYHINLTNSVIPDSKKLAVVKAMSKLSTLRHINLSYITATSEVDDELASIVANNANLQHLKLSGCLLTSTGVMKVAEALNCTKFSELSHLNLSGNAVNGEAITALFTVLAGCGMLKVLELSNCSISEIETSIFNKVFAVTTLTHLDLSKNSITDEHADAVATFIANNTSLEHLDLSCCGFKSTGVLKIVTRLNNLTTLLYLNFGLNHLTDQLEALALVMSTLIARNSSIKHLYLPCGMFQDKQLKYLLGAMKTIDSLVCVDFSYNHISSGLYNHVAEMLISNRNLKEIKIQGLLLTQSGFHHLYNILTKFQISQCSLHQIDNLDQYIMKLSSLFKNNSNLTHFSFTNCILSDLGMSELFKSFNFMRFLRNLDLRNLIFFEGTSVLLASVLRANKSIDHFSLAHCKMSELGKANIFTALRSITELQHFSINNIVIRKHAHSTIAVIISNNKKLKSLELIDCKITKQGMDWICDTLDNHKHLVCIKLNGNDIVLGTTLLNTISNSAGLNTIEMAGCHLKTRDVINLVKSIRQCQQRGFIHLNLSRNNLTYEAIMSVLSIQELIYLDISHNVINYTGAKIIESFIFKNDKIQHVNLSNCKLQSSAINMIITAMKSTTSLQFIDLSMNDASDGFIVTIGPVISNNESLTFLHLPTCSLSKYNLNSVLNAMANIVFVKYSKTGNYFFAIMEVEDSTILKLKLFDFVKDYCEYAAENPEKVLNTECFGIEDLAQFVPNCLVMEVGVHNILRLIENTCSLQYLSLQNVNITDMMEGDVVSAITKNTNLQSVEMVGCTMTDHGVSEISKAIASLKYMSPQNT